MSDDNPTVTEHLGDDLPSDPVTAHLPLQKPWLVKSSRGAYGGEFDSREDAEATCRNLNARTELRWDSWGVYAVEERRCPDDGSCSKDCGDAGCWRVSFCAPLSSYGEDWTNEDRAANANPPIRIESILILEEPWTTWDE